MPTPAPAPSLSGAVDLSTLATRPQPPVTPGPGADTAPTPDGEVPKEFTLSVGNVEGDAVVLLGFGHLRWVFAPELAEDLGSSLLDAAAQARRISANGMTEQVTR
jgi:hypothetical protein